MVQLHSLLSDSLEVVMSLQHAYDRMKEAEVLLNNEVVSGTPASINFASHMFNSWLDRAKGLAKQ